MDCSQAAVRVVASRQGPGELLTVYGDRWYSRPDFIESVIESTGSYIGTIQWRYTPFRDGGAKTRFNQSRSILYIQSGGLMCVYYVKLRRRPIYVACVRLMGRLVCIATTYEDYLKRVVWKVSEKKIRKLREVSPYLYNMVRTKARGELPEAEVDDLSVRLWELTRRKTHILTTMQRTVEWFILRQMMVTSSVASKYLADASCSLREPTTARAGDIAGWATIEQVADAIQRQLGVEAADAYLAWHRGAGRKRHRSSRFADTWITGNLRHVRLHKGAEPLSHPIFKTASFVYLQDASKRTKQLECRYCRGKDSAGNYYARRTIYVCGTCRVALCIESSGSTRAGASCFHKFHNLEQQSPTRARDGRYLKKPR